MKKYKVTYKNEFNEVSSVVLEAPNKTILAMVIVESITDMLDDDAFNIIRVEEV